MRPVFLVLLHEPMVDRHGKEVVTAVTNLDIHDIARSCRTFGVQRYFIVNPEPEQERLVNSIIGHWHQEISKVYHPSRADALGTVQFARSFEEAFNEITRLCGERPLVAMPDARDLSEWFKKIWNYSEFREVLQENSKQPVVLVFGTGWGIAPRFFPKVDCLLAPIRAENQKYNHLSVRAAVAIILDRLLGLR